MNPIRITMLQDPGHNRTLEQSRNEQTDLGHRRQRSWALPKRLPRSDRSIAEESLSDFSTDVENRHRLPLTLE